MYIIFAFILIVIIVAVILASTLALKLKWLNSICISVILLTVFAVLVLESGVYGLSGARLPLFIIILPALVCIVILIVKFFQRFFSTSASQSAVNPEERGRILKLVEDGKINAEEGKELLDAMGKSSALRGEEKFTRVDLAILAGVGLVVLGFFLPWNYVRLPNMHIPGIEVFDTNSAYQAGYNAGALGWTIFIIALASAIPVFVTPRNLLYKISMLQIFLTVIGVILVISVLVQVGEHLGVGLIICLAGFLTAFFASLAKFKSLAA